MMLRVAAEFRCRGDDAKVIYADAIREQVDAMRHLRLGRTVPVALRPARASSYLSWLREVSL